MVQNRLTERLAARGSRKLFCPYISSGFPSQAATVPMMLGLQKGGADVIELGVPFSEPQADGPVIEASNHMALRGGTTMRVVLDTIKQARKEGLEVPVVLMGYLNPILQYRDPAVETPAGKRHPPPASVEVFVQHAKESGADGFIVVDMPPDDPSSAKILAACTAHDMCYIPLLSPTTTPARLAELCEHATGFVYAISQLGTTGSDISRSFNPEAKAVEHSSSRSAEEAALDSGLRQPLDLPTFIERVRVATKGKQLPIAVGFGIKSRDDAVQVCKHADMAVVGSQCIRVVMKSLEHDAQGRPKLLTPEQEKELIPKIAADMEAYAKAMSLN